MWKDFFFFSKGERNGLIILASLIILMFAVNFCLPTQDAIPKEIAEGKAVRDSLAGKIMKDSTRHDPIDKKVDTSQRTTYYQKRLYEKNNQSTTRKGNGEGARKEPTYATKTKGKESYMNLLVEINNADTTELKKLRGIGSVLSKRIVKYRKMLGGFKDVEQLKKVYGLSEETYQEILPHIWIDTSANKANQKEATGGTEGGNQDNVSSSGGSVKSSSSSSTK